jgi:DNA-binding beta-propeller fold protein YncE
MLYGSGKYTYELVEGWAKLPEGWNFLDIGGLNADAQDNVYVFSRSPHSMMVFDRNGNFLRSWGEGYFKRAHGSRIDLNGNVYCTDDGAHTVTKFSPDGKVLQVIGEKGKWSDTGYKPSGTLMEALKSIQRGAPPFNRPTGVAFSKSGDFYVSDGYGNARVHKFSPEGKLLLSWGEPGTGPGEFMLPHNVRVDRFDRVWVADRENSRIQIFDNQGKFLTQWTNVIRPTDIYIDKNDVVYISQLAPAVGIFTIEGKELARISCVPKDPATDLMIAPHALGVDSRGDIYVGEVAMNHAKYDRGSRAVQKFARKA